MQNNTKKILIADDEELIRQTVLNFLEDRDFQVVEASNGKAALDLIRSRMPDLVLLDLRMPELDGLQVLKTLGVEQPDLPVIIISGEGDLNDAINCLRWGAWDYLTKPIHDLGLLEHRIEKALERSQLLLESRRYKKSLEEQVNLKSQEVMKKNKSLRIALTDTIQVISRLIELKDPYTAGHEKRVADLAVAIGKELQLERSKLDGLYMASLIHDLGKVTVPSALLVKPGKLTEHEFGVIKQHAQAGYEILKNSRFPWPIATIVLQHHERIDGSGYPNGLKGDEMLLESRIIAIADTVEAMSSNRPYRYGRGIDITLQEIEQGQGLKYDADAAAACLELFRSGRFSFTEWKIVNNT